MATTKTFRLIDDSDKAFDDLVIFDEEQEIAEVKAKVDGVKARDEYDFDDILKALDELGSYSVQPIETLGVAIYY